jgi:hypothetical protein
MKLIESKLYLEWRDALECGIPKGTLDGAKARKSPSWIFIDDPDDKRRVLIDYEKLSDSNKEKIKINFGNPYEYMAKQPIRDLIKWDDKAEEFYLAYRYDGNKPLPIEHVKKYTAAASLINMVNTQLADKKTMKKLLNLSIDKFFVHLMDIIEVDNIPLPTTYKRLIGRCGEFKESGFECLISKKFGNKQAAKIKDEMSESTLTEMIAHPNQYDDVFITQQYNAWAKKNSYKEIDSATVGVWRRKKESEVIMFREGNAALKDKFLRQAKGFRPTQPLYLLESDDNHLDLLFLDPNDETQHKHYHKYKAIVVTDSFNDYVLGYAYAETLSPELVKAAYLNAMYYVRSLTNNWLLPQETKTDRWALKTLMPFYESLGKYFPTPVGSKNRGYIENFFGTPHWKRCLKIGANNYTGNNMTAKYRGVNQEVLGRNKKDYPLIGIEASTQIENFFHRLRHLPQSNGVSKHEQWMQAVSVMPKESKRLINDEQFLLKFGVEHNNHGKGISITNRGVTPQINGTRYSFDLQVPSLMEYVGKTVSILYDPFDMSRVLVTDFDKVRVMAVDARLNSRALQDANTDSRVYLNAILNEKRDDVDYVSTRSTRRKQVLESAGIDAEGLLQAGVMVKEIKQAAEQKLLVTSIGGISYEEDLYDQM